MVPRRWCPRLSYQPNKKPDVACDTGLMIPHGIGRASQAQMEQGHIRLLMGETAFA